MCVLASYRLKFPRAIVISIKNEFVIVWNSFLAPAASTLDKKNLHIAGIEGVT